MDDSSDFGRIDPVGGPTPVPALELKTDDVLVALTAALRFRIVLGWLPRTEPEAAS